MYINFIKYMFNIILILCIYEYISAILIDLKFNMYLDLFPDNCDINKVNIDLIV